MGLLKRLLGQPVSPPVCAGNPGIATGGKVGFARGDRSWNESFDLVEILAEALRGRGHRVTSHKTWLELPATGFVLQPKIVEIIPLDEGGARTVTTIDVRHPTLIPRGLYEYQHAVGDTVVASAARGFCDWEELDLRVLGDALRKRPEHCTCIEMPFPAKDGRPARRRRAVLGSVWHYVANPEPAVDAPACEHPFCTCCFLTRNFETFKPYVEDDGYRAIRFYAARGIDDAASADCRINGDEFEPGKNALRRYVASWPGKGIEIRKQYVFVHTLGDDVP